MPDVWNTGAWQREVKRYLEKHDVKDGFMTPDDYKNLMTGLPRSVKLGIPKTDENF